MKRLIVLIFITTLINYAALFSGCSKKEDENNSNKNNSDCSIATETLKYILYNDEKITTSYRYDSIGRLAVVASSFYNMYKEFSIYNYNVVLGIINYDNNTTVFKSDRDSITSVVTYNSDGLPVSVNFRNTVYMNKTNASYSSEKKLTGIVSEFYYLSDTIVPESITDFVGFIYNGDNLTSFAIHNSNETNIVICSATYYTDKENTVFDYRKYYDPFSRYIKSEFIFNAFSKNLIKSFQISDDFSHTEASFSYKYDAGGKVSSYNVELTEDLNTSYLENVISYECN